MFKFVLRGHSKMKETFLCITIVFIVAKTLHIQVTRTFLHQKENSRVSGLCQMTQEMTGYSKYINV